MMVFDATWLAFGLFLLACGGVPAVAALVAERRGQPPRHGALGRASDRPAPRLFHEDDRGAAPPDLQRARDCVTALGRAPFSPQHRPAASL